MLARVTEALDRPNRLRSFSRRLPLGPRILARQAFDEVSARRRAPVFWTKSLAYRLTPGGYGYYRKLRRLEDAGYVHERDKHPVRRKHYETYGWREAVEGGLRQRDYQDYDEYVVHQRQKLDEVLKLGGFFSNRAVFATRLRFYRRFRHLVPLLPRDATILCAGARTGIEVEVLRELGFRRAYGIDLNPGPANQLVRPGDFHSLENETSSVDLVYSNSLDHVFDFERFFGEHARAIKPEGYVLYDLTVGGGTLGGPAEAVAWEREDVLLPQMLAHFRRVVRVESEPGWKWLLLQGKL
jgi:methyltransferase family protein